MIPKSEIYTPKKSTEHPHACQMGVPLGSPRRQILINRTQTNKIKCIDVIELVWGLYWENIGRVLFLQVYVVQ